MSEAGVDVVEYYCALPWAGFPFQVEDGVVSKAPSTRCENETILKTAQWMIGKDVSYVTHWVEDHHGEVTFQ